jgi:hypothetical protein
VRAIPTELLGVDVDRKLHVFQEVEALDSTGEKPLRVLGH